MKTLLLAGLFSMSTLAYAAETKPSPEALRLISKAPFKIAQACVNPGGSCNGTIPCCGPNENFCVRNRCQPVPE